MKMWYKCELCGKDFHAPDIREWAYQRTMYLTSDKYRGKKHYFCSWKCLCAAQKGASDYYEERLRREKEKKREYARQKYLERMEKRKTPDIGE